MEESLSAQADLMFSERENQQFVLNDNGDYDNFKKKTQKHKIQQSKDTASPRQFI